jgi:hypothetical protein
MLSVIVVGLLLGENSSLSRAVPGVEELHLVAVTLPPAAMRLAQPVAVRRPVFAAMLPHLVRVCGAPLALVGTTAGKALPAIPDVDPRPAALRAGVVDRIVNTGL